MFAITKVKADRPCRIRVYESLQAIAVDLERPSTSSPIGHQHGVVCDLVFEKAGEMKLNPYAFADDLQKCMLVEPFATVEIDCNLIASTHFSATHPADDLVRIEAICASG